MPINEVHLNALLETIPQFQNQGAFGHVPRIFLNRIINRIDINNRDQNLIDIQNEIPDIRLDRNSVFQICNNENYSFAYKVVSAFAWGAMRQSPTGAYLFFNNWNIYNNTLEDIIENFRNNATTREITYENIRNMQTQGCGPAYYTKLLFFFGYGNTYIMDQWTSKSIELLWTPEDRIGIIFDGQRRYIQAANDGGIYDEFCNRLEQLTQIINDRLNSNYTANAIEEIIFSNGRYMGQLPGQWRQYVVNNW
jgi:hypothetical protein